MDPKANIDEQVKLASLIIDSSNEQDAIDLAELVTALHNWRANGGFDPYAERWIETEVTDDGWLRAVQPVRAERSATHQENAALALLRTVQAELVTLVARLDQPAQRNVRALLDQIKATLSNPYPRSGNDAD